MGEDGHDHADHKHAVGDHTYSVGVNADGRYLTIALLLIVGFMVFEVVVGIVAHSLALPVFIGTLIAGIVILVTGFDRADAIASLFVAVLMLRSGFDLQRKAIRVLLEGAGRGATCRGRCGDGAWRARERGARSAPVGTCTGPSHLDGACARSAG